MFVLVSKYKCINPSSSTMCSLVHLDTHLLNVLSQAVNDA